MKIQGSSQQGQTLIEVIVGIALAIIIIGSLVYTILKSASLTTSSKLQVAASNYAQDGIEQVRAMKNSNITSIEGTAGTSTIYCFSNTDGSSGVCSYPNSNAVNGGGSGPFCGVTDTANITKCQYVAPSDPLGKYLIRTLTLEPGSADCTAADSSSNGSKAIVTVYWNDSKCPSTDLYCNKVEFTTCLNTYSVPTP